MDEPPGARAHSIGQYVDRTSDVRLPERDWPVHGSVTRPWRQSQRGGTAADRKLSEVTAALPPLIARLDYTATASVQSLVEEAVAAITLLDTEDGGDLAAFSRFLIQIEAVSSSKIEHVEARTEDFARALIGIRADAAATSMVAASRAITAMIDRAGETGAITLADTLDAHRLLLADDPLYGRYAGALRRMQNWIGGSDHSPRGAVHVPPPADTLEMYLDDLYTFANRDDLPVIVQAAIVHAQFESIHPFTDGNGRIGRALINAVLRRRGLTHRAIVPVASAMVADRAGYFALVNAYRDGVLGPFVESLARSAIVAAGESRESARRLRAMPADWSELVPARAGSASARLLDALLAHPVLAADEVEGITGGSSQAYRAIEQLEAAGILREITGRRRDRVWIAVDVSAELDDLAARIAARVQLSGR